MNEYESLMQPVTNNVMPINPDIPEPLPLSAECPPEPYPLDVLPKDLQNAIREVQDYTQANTALVANNALGALALACQGLAKVCIDENLIQPINLYLLTIAAPNERKTSIENYFLSSLKCYEHDQCRVLEPKWEQYRTDKESFEAKIKGIKQSIQKLSKEGEPTQEEEQRLLALEKERPQQPMFVKMRYNDTNQPALLHGLATKYPTAAIMTSEGGAFFGGASFASDSTLSSFSMFNELWSGSTIQIDRKGEGSTNLTDVALSLNVAVQPDVLENFVNRTRSIVRGSGFFARCLFANPFSTIGYRPYKAPPDNMVLTNTFNNRLSELLKEQPDRISENGTLERALIGLSEEAKHVWITFNNEVEQAQQFGGDWEEISDIAGKAANNAARIACLFHLLDHGLEAEISAEHMQSACTLMTWHLQEAKRYFGTSELPEELEDAIRQYDFLIERFKRTGRTSITLRELQRTARGGKAARQQKRLIPAIAVLTDQRRLIVNDDGSKRTYHLNPKLLHEVQA